MKLTNNDWYVKARRLIDAYRNDNDLSLLKKSLININPFSINLFEYGGYQTWILDNMLAVEKGDFTRISDTSSNSILNSDDEDDEDDKDMGNDIARSQAKSCKVLTLPKYGGMERIQTDVEDLCIKCQKWIGLLVGRWSDFHDMDTNETLDIPENLRRSFRSVGLQTKEHVGGPGSGMEHVAAGVDLDGIITENGKHIAWEDLEGETAVIEVAYHLDEIIAFLFTKTAQGIIEKMLNEIYGDMTSSNNGQSNNDVAREICEALHVEKFLKL